MSNHQENQIRKSDNTKSNFKLLSKIRYRVKEKNRLVETAVNINEQLKTFYRLQQEWVNRAYKNWNDFDTYLILMYLMNKVYINYSDRFHYMSMEAFYSQEKVGIEKLNLIEISKNLNIPKETVRRKVNFLQINGIIVRSGKTIFLHSNG